MAKQFEQINRMNEKAERLREKALLASDSRIADKFLAQADNVLASIQAIKANWKEFGERAKGNRNFKGKRHSEKLKQR